MIRAFARWLFMRTHQAELKHCAAYARGHLPIHHDPLIKSSMSVGMLDALEILDLFK